MHIKFWHQLAILKALKPYTLAGFEPKILSSGGGRDDHYATPQGRISFKFNKTKKKYWIGSRFFLYLFPPEPEFSSQEVGEPLHLTPLIAANRLQGPIS
jgi:hypothetical protein